MADRPSTRPEIDEEFREKLRNDPRVIVHRRSATEPFEPKIRLTAPVDVNWLIGRREDHEVEPYLRGIDDDQSAPTEGVPVMTQQTSTRPEIDEEFLEQLRNDPDVIVHYRKTTEPFVSQLRVTAPVDVLWLMGRREDHEVEPYLRGIDE
jgi:hypothetical protein